MARKWPPMPLGELLFDFCNVGSSSPYRAFPGFPSDSAHHHHHLLPKGAVKLKLSAGQLLHADGDAKDLGFVAFDTKGKSVPNALGLSERRPLSELEFDDGTFLAWARATGADVQGLYVACASVKGPGVFKAQTDCTVWAVLPSSPHDIVAGQSHEHVSICVDRENLSVTLPEPFGKVVDEFTVSRGTARAYEVLRGQFVQIIDIEGQQCSDFMAFRKDELDRGFEVLIDSTATRSMVRHAYPRPGLLDKFFDHNMRPLLQVVQDTCGRHDTFGLACTARGYEDRGFPGHVNCSDNISDAISGYGVQRRSAWPAINFFWNTWIDPHSHQLLTEESFSRPGDYVVMRALEDLICVSTACPDDIDPINGWNPTDIHVRIYAPQTPISRAIGFRAKEDSVMQVSQESAFHTRTSELTTDFVAARNLWVPATYPSTGTLGEYWACREKVTLQDMSSLRKYDIVGPDAERLLQQLLTRDLSRLAQWRATYALMCDETGAVVDDGTLFRLGPQLFRWCCGSEESARRIEALADQHSLQVRVQDLSEALVNVALQGPKSRELLSKIVFTQPHVPSLEHLKWFGVTIGRLNDREGVPFMLSRTGYTGELGYELFCSKSDAVAVWDTLMHDGASLGIEPMGTAALDIIRIEAGFAAAGAEFGPGVDAWEAGLGFAVDMRKDSFVGKAALERNATAQRRALKGLVVEGDDVPLSHASVYAGERVVGEVTSATRSPLLGRGIAMARLAVEYSDQNTELEIGMMDGRMKRLPCRVVDIPFVDPKREKARA